MTIKFIPKFRKNIEYSEQSPHDGEYKYRFITKHEIALNHNLKIDRQYKYLSGGKVWLRITPHNIIISKDYAWDGCTPKKWWGIWWGTPDFKNNIFGSLIHDALLQFHRRENFPLIREEIDIIFRDILKENKFPLWWVYYQGVKLKTKSIINSNSLTNRSKG